MSGLINRVCSGNNDRQRGLKDLRELNEVIEEDHVAQSIRSARGSLLFNLIANTHATIY